ncbi:molybdenum cofactor guanylyltransferase MobA [Extensimonas sp. H3M7-6]|uniref:molybdenum cofactor guanylyltransferase MobA n=1 Tax=Extensimonas soli TaxID=3031322 RepID=UPI0023D9B824|nr:molybdenum cofactor guanylyltransferase MobA [Extensimonas sp. H3M7-6]MDF1481428.1 molybdenum cofactor guanylyltransferase MobA [Extensimonas sp. H3M7-6]
MEIQTSDITGLVLAGGQGARMGGLDKGLQPFRGVPLALHALRRLQPQVGACMLSANRNLDAYAAFGVPVWPDARPVGQPDHTGPLAGFLSGLAHCRTPWLLTVPCDTPLFPTDLAARMVAALARTGADMAMAAAPELPAGGSPTAPRLRAQPVFCLLPTRLRSSLEDYIRSGGRKIAAWTERQHCALVPFDQPGDTPRAFANANTVAELHALELAPQVPAGLSPEIEGVHDLSPKGKPRRSGFMDMT